jgi:hypothetical protein
MEMSGQFHHLSLYTLGHILRYKSDTKLCAPQSRPGRYGEVEHLLSLPGTESRFLNCQARSLFALTNDIS